MTREHVVFHLVIPFKENVTVNKRFDEYKTQLKMNKNGVCIIYQGNVGYSVFRLFSCCVLLRCAYTRESAIK